MASNLTHLFHMPTSSSSSHVRWLLHNAVGTAVLRNVPLLWTTMATSSGKLALRPVAMDPDGILTHITEATSSDVKCSAVLVDPNELSLAEVEYLTLVSHAVSKLNPSTQSPSTPIKPDAASTTRKGFDYFASLLGHAHDQLGRPLRPMWRATAVEPIWVLPILILSHAAPPTPGPDPMDEAVQASTKSGELHLPGQNASPYPTQRHHGETLLTTCSAVHHEQAPCSVRSASAIC